MKTYVIDIDGTICKQVEGEMPHYIDAQPMYDRIDRVNSLYDEGNKIIYFTARGMGRTSGNRVKAIDMFYRDTMVQLNTWGAKFHMLLLGKPAGDVYVDDKGINASDFFK